MIYNILYTLYLHIYLANRPMYKGSTFDPLPLTVNIANYEMALGRYMVTGSGRYFSKHHYLTFIFPVFDKTSDGNLMNQNKLLLSQQEAAPPN